MFMAKKQNPTILSLGWIFIFCGLTSGDIYMQNPRGSNNRLNENTAARTNANRLFDSQNNNRGGYNVGDATSAAAGGNEKLQYQMKYFQSSATAESELAIEWTMQHGCGLKSPDKKTTLNEIDCQAVLQYMCQDASTAQTTTQRMRDGTNTNAQDYTQLGTINKNTYAGSAQSRETQNVKTDRGLHENWQNYESCNIRERNTGLFTADVQLGKNRQYSSAVYTRQNPNGNRRGYECPEERDYYPYWHPNPWKDIALLVTNDAQCRDLKFRSFNVQPRHECIEIDNAQRRVPSRWNNAYDCKKNGGRWLLLHNYLEKATKFTTQELCTSQSPGRQHYMWAIPYDSPTLKAECLVSLAYPECKRAPWARANHLGNTLNAETPNYIWTLPYFPSGRTQTCVLRIRYNISSYDYDPTTDYTQNLNKKLNIVPPVQKNPLWLNLQLTMDTTQLGRTFQDRSHTFQLVSRPPKLEDQHLYNLNVRGKRGNIVQTFPATEYDFAPTVLKMDDESLVHIQWTGSNTHNNQPDGADGVGTQGTDRNNIVQIGDLGENYPLPIEEATLWQNAKIKWIYFGKESISSLSLALNLASAGFYRCLNATECPEAEHKNFVLQTQGGKIVEPGGKKINNVLNNVPASYEGVVIQLKKGTYRIMCTRNNNFSNRSQKSTIIVV